VLGIVITVLFGLALGWSPHLSLLHGIELVGLLALGMLAFTWCGVLVGMLVRSPDAVQGMGFIVILPLTFMAGTFVPISGMDAIPQRGEVDDGLALVASAIAQQPGWRELLARLAPEQWPVAGPLLERLRAAGRASQG
jgi:ABC-2 type transport system permease protein